MATPPQQYPTTKEIVVLSSCTAHRRRSCTSNYACLNRPYGYDNTSPIKGDLSGCVDSYNPDTSGCYGYDSDADHLYKCQGHRSPIDKEDEDQQRGDLPQPEDHTIVFAEYLSALYNALNKEINDPNYGRKKHAMYVTLLSSSTDASAGKIAKLTQPNSLESSIENLRRLIDQYDDKKYDATTSSLYSNVYDSNIMKKDDIYKMYEEINNKWRDCVCHNDCVEFGKIEYYHSQCYCNGNCGCDYGSARER